MKKALIIGLNKYPNCPLSWCDNDAIAIKDLIESNGDGSPNFDVELITDECSKEELDNFIERLFEDINYHRELEYLKKCDYENVANIYLNY